LALAICIGLTTIFKAQTPADGSDGFPTGPNSGSSGDGVPTVPFDGALSLMFATSGIT
jgi:hypothetical protein